MAFPKPITTPTVQNQTLTNADTEYSLTVTRGAQKICFQSQPVSGVQHDIRYAFVTGKVATPTAPWMTLTAGATWVWEGNTLLASDLTIYFASGTAGAIVELEEWA